MTAVVVPLTVLGVAATAFLLFRIAEALFHRGDGRRVVEPPAVVAPVWDGASLDGLPGEQIVIDHLDVILADPALRRESVLCYVEFDELSGITPIERDAVVVETLRRLRGACREEDTIARLGEAHFVLVAAGVLDNDGALALAARLGRAASEPIGLDGLEVRAPASVGVTFLAEGDDPASVIARGGENLRLARGDLAT